MKEQKNKLQSIRSEAKRAADAVRAEANANANRVVNEAKNPVTKRAAEYRQKRSGMREKQKPRR
jgi:vacuolar-type H+-ATPase subunit E/Vma4